MNYTCTACSTNIRDEWRYCPECGRYAGEITIENRPLCYDFSPGHPVPRWLHLKNRGPAPISYRVGIAGADALRVTSGSVGELRQGVSPIAIEISRLPHATEQPMLRLFTTDGPRNDPWADPVERAHPPVPIEIREVQPPRLMIRPELVVLTDQRRHRTLHIINEGNDPVEVTLPVLPPGVRYTGNPLHQNHARVTIPVGQLAGVEIGLLNPEADVSRTVTFEADTGQKLPIQIAVHLSQLPDIMPAYIVGVDFGTRNSSVFVRRVGAPGGDGDEILPGVPIASEDEARTGASTSEGSTRFPSAMHLGEDDQWRFGAAAIRRWDDEGAGSREVIRNLKTLLRDHRDSVKVGNRSFDVRELIGLFLGHVGEMARRRIELWEGQRTSAGNTTIHDLETIFVLSLPILDGGAEYEELKSAMQDIVLEYLLPPDRSQYLQFAQEPVCAALYIIDQVNRGKLHLQLGNGSRLVVFDSGGGTTDIVLGVVELQGGRVGLRLVNQVGLDAEGYTFGGNDVDRRLLTEVLNAEPLRLFDRAAFDNRWKSRDLPKRTEAVAELLEPLKRAAILKVVADSLGPLESLRRAAILKQLERNGDPGDPRLDRLGPDLLRMDSSFVTEHGFQGFDETQYPHVTPEHVHAAAELITTTCDAVRKQWFQEAGINPQADVDYVFLVGGNTMIPLVREEVRKCFRLRPFEGRDRVVILEPEQTLEAVGRGTVLVPDARLDNTHAYSIALRAESPGQKPITLWERTAGSVLTPQRVRKDSLFRHRSIVVSLSAKVGDRWAVLAQSTVPVPEGGGQICRVVAELAIKGDGPQLSVSYAIDPKNPNWPMEQLFTYAI